MTPAEYNNRKIPPYYRTMYLDGYTPQEIYEAHRRKMLELINGNNDVPTVKIVSEIKKKWKTIVKIRRKINSLF